MTNEGHAKSGHIIKGIIKLDGDENFVKTDLDYSASSKKIENKDNSGLKLVDGYGCIKESKYWLKIQHNK